MPLWTNWGKPYHPNSLNIDEFVKQPRGPFHFDHYKHPTLIPSPLGEFAVELSMGIGDDSPPDLTMIKLAEQLVKQFVKDQVQVVRLVYGDYKAACNDPEYLEFCKCPLNLTLYDLPNHLSARAISISRDLDVSEMSYEAHVYMSPRWDKEHGFCLEHKDGSWKVVD